jgi:class 3 adenylate cyclase
MPDLSARERAALPDAAFAYVDSAGKRRLPIHDEAHVRNALARFNRVVFESEEARDRSRTRLLKAAKRYGIMPVGFIDGQLRPRLPTGHVALLFADLVDSTTHLAELGDRYGPMLTTVRRLLRTAVRRHGGVEVDARADEYFAAFTTAESALSAAVAVQGAVAAHPWPDDRDVGLRIGVHSGRPTVTAGGYVGIAVNTVARICALADGGEILVSRSARASLGDAVAAWPMTERGLHRLRGIPDEVELFALR